MSLRSESKPAILGGLPVRPGGPPLWPADDRLVAAVIEKLIASRDWGRYHGPHVPELCRMLSEYHRVEHVHLCSSGTAAVELALRGAGVASNDEVVLAGYDFKANFQNVLCLGSLPVLVDLDPLTWQINADRIESAVTDRTKAILISHLHGGHVDAQRVRQLADSRGIALIEDACQNPGAIVQGRVAGTWGDVGVLSFGGSKLLTAGRGGAVMTSRREISERIKRHVLRGNDAYPISEMQAAILCPQLQRLDDSNSLRRQTVSHLCQRINDVSGLVPLQLPTDNLLAAYYKVGFRYHSAEFGGLSRNRFVQALRAEGIPFDAGFRSLHLIHASRRFRAADDLREASLADTGMLTLHHPILLEGDSAVEQIELAIRKVRAAAEEIQREVPECELEIK